MTKEKLAEQLNGSQYGEIDPELVSIAREHNLVIITGASDDLIEIEGAIDDEFVEGKIVFAKAGEKIVIEDDGDDFTGKTMKRDGALQLEDNSTTTKNVVAGTYDRGGCGHWEFTTELPVAEFKVYDEGDLQSVGIIIDLRDLIN